MRTDYFLGQNRGDDYRSSIKSYSLQAWRDAGGEDGNEPYFEEDVQRRGLDYCPVIRVYVDARIFSTWEAWKAEAERAKLGAIKGKDIYGGLAFFGGGYSRIRHEDMDQRALSQRIGVLPGKGGRGGRSCAPQTTRRSSQCAEQLTAYHPVLLPPEPAQRVGKATGTLGGTVMRRPETPLRAISAYCLAECCLGKPHRVDACQESECPLHAFRYGTDPYKEERPGGAVSSRRGRVQ